ncbi:hypothetical protein [Stutzerimonas nitrititolerans]|uniref:hypothetical protein n=1 Tax=Stutzerimonas nitrititolerans TaxID=2482751 RepID=UPI0028986523|nr:hypothetical protein [Stutzerimonas nitrititolerans]
MSYEITVNKYECYAMAFIEIFQLSEFSKSVRVCRLQGIGWIVDAAMLALESVNEAWPDGLENPEHVIERLMTLCLLSKDEAETIMNLGTVQERFSYAWSLLDDKEKRTAVSFDWRGWDNYWPGFQDYSGILSSVMGVDVY